MDFDFTQLSGSSQAQSPIDPIELFQNLPNLDGTHNDLWLGQGTALRDWHQDREQSDILVSLNTGAGKTVVGLIIAQSLINEGLKKVLYVCSTINLVEQTEEEAKRIGIDCTTRIYGGYSNNLFKTGKAFCITTYHALFSGINAFQSQNFPEAIIFDDAHVAESMLRQAFTLRIESRKKPQLFSSVAENFRAHFKEINIEERFRNAIDPDSSIYATALVAPNGLRDYKQQLLNIFRQYKVNEDDDLKFSYAWLADHIDACVAIFSSGVFELSPPFLPSLALDIFQLSRRRIYLSATLQSQTAFIRAFGRSPSKIIAPSNDAGNGERLIIFGESDKCNYDDSFVERVKGTWKVLISVPSNKQAQLWSNVAEILDRDNISLKLKEFKSSEAGAIVLVSRVDGIDLPHNACRVMIVNGLPFATSLLERYQWEYLHMGKLHATRVANRIAQLFGRINRGRNDYGVFLIEGKDIYDWLDNESNLVLLPPLLRKQISVGRRVQKHFNVSDHDTTIALMNKVFDRDGENTWISFYRTQVNQSDLDKDQISRHNNAEPAMVEATRGEAMYASEMWRHNPDLARGYLERTVENTTKFDPTMGGWHALWIGAALEQEGDIIGARRQYEAATRRLGVNMALPRLERNRASDRGIEFNAFGQFLRSNFDYDNDRNFNNARSDLFQQISLITNQVVEDPIKAANDAEEAVRLLGEMLGFCTSRPDGTNRRGPDVLWCDEKQTRQLGFELKTNKRSPAFYSKTKDIGQGYNHIGWMKNNYPTHVIIGLVFVGPSGKVDASADPSNNMSLCIPSKFIQIRDELFAIIDDLKNFNPLEREIEIMRVTQEAKWDIEEVFKRLATTPMPNLK